MKQLRDSRGRFVCASTNGTPKTVKGYKGFDRDLKCLGKQYAVGETFTVHGRLKLCENGLHFCSSPLSVLGYYAPVRSRYCEVTATGRVLSDCVDGTISKSCARTLTVEKELTSAEFAYKALDYTVKHCTESFDGSDRDSSEPYHHVCCVSHCACAEAENPYSVASTRCYYHSVAVVRDAHSVAYAKEYSTVAVACSVESVAIADGISGVAATLDRDSICVAAGERAVAVAVKSDSRAVASGRDSVAVCAEGFVEALKAGSVAFGYSDTLCSSLFSGVLGSWFVVHIRKDNGNVCVKTAEVDGKRILPDTWYYYDGEQWIIKEW